MSLLGSVLPILLAGGQGSRLHELTERECKPAVPFAGGRRIVDWTLENTVNAGFGRLIVATQYCPSTLEYHLRAAWGREFDDLRIFRGPRLTGTHQGFVGTADAVAKVLPPALGHETEVLILSADHIYEMDYTEMIAAHRASGAVVTVAATTTDLDSARGFGVIAADPFGTITGFEEKPENPAPMASDPDRAIVSMGIYVFDRDWLEAALAEDAADPVSGHDFGRDIVPKAASMGGAAVHVPQSKGRPFYWRDVGTLDAYRTAALDFARGTGPCALPRARTRTTQGPDGANTLGGFVLGDSVVMPGAWIEAGSDITRAIIGPNTVVPADLVVGRNAREDALWFRLAPGGTRLVTAAMLMRRDAMLHLSRRPVSTGRFRLQNAR